MKIKNDHKLELLLGRHSLLYLHILYKENTVLLTINDLYINTIELIALGL